jgi:predicted membrane protein
MTTSAIVSIVYQVRGQVAAFAVAAATQPGALLQPFLVHYGRRTLRREEIAHCPVLSHEHAAFVLALLDIKVWVWDSLLSCLVAASMIICWLGAEREIWHLAVAEDADEFCKHSALTIDRAAYCVIVAGNHSQFMWHVA